jgi:signal transduction histidine kinase
MKKQESASNKKKKIELIAIVSHQLRMPLTANKWYLEMFLHGDFGPVSSKQKQFLEEMYATNEKMIGLVNDLLSVAELEGGKSLLALEFPGSAPLREALKDVSHFAEEKGVSIKAPIPSHVPSLCSEPRLLHQVFANLLMNAIQYSHKGSCIHVKHTVSKGALQISIADEGIGIGNADKEYIFSKFFRSERAKKMQPGGSGLGLYIVRSILEKLGGVIDFASQEGKGTTFTVSLPLSKEKK